MLARTVTLRVAMRWALGLLETTAGPGVEGV